MPDAQTVPREGGFEGLYASLWPEMVRLGRLLTGSTAAGEELAQDAFIGLLRSFAGVRNPRAYLRQSMVNGVRTAHRRRPEHDELTDRHEPSVLPPEIDETWQALRVLTDRQRSVVVLRFYEDLSHAEIAAALGCSVGTVKSTLSRSLSRLRKEMA